MESPRSPTGAAQRAGSHGALGRFRAWNAGDAPAAQLVEARREVSQALASEQEVAPLIGGCTQTEKRRVLVAAQRYHHRLTLTNSTALGALSALRRSLSARQLRGLRTPLIKESRIDKLIAASVPNKRRTPASAAKRTCIVLLSMVLSAVSCVARAEADYPAGDRPRPWSIAQWYVFTSLYTHHFDADPDHVNNQKMLGLEAGMQNRWVFGLALFDNSFGQNTQYLYAGYKWALFGSELWHFKLTGGLLHGYKEPYESKIPLNDLSVAPAIVPTLGFQYGFLAAEFNLAGTAAFTITAGIAL